MYHQHPLHQAPPDMMQLQRWMNAHTTSQALAMRARIVVTAHAHPTWTSRTLAQSLGVSDRLVRKCPRDAQRDRLLGVRYPGKEKRVELRVPQWNRNDEIGRILLSNCTHLTKIPLVSNARSKEACG